MDELIQILENDCKKIFSNRDCHTQPFMSEVDKLTAEEKENIREKVTGLLLLAEQTAVSDENMVKTINKAKREVRKADAYQIVYLRTLLIFFTRNVYCNTKPDISMLTDF